MKAGMRKDLVKMMALVFVCRVGRKAGKRAVKELLISEGTTYFLFD